jgi:hypothetical protein
VSYESGKAAAELVFSQNPFLAEPMVFLHKPLRGVKWGTVEQVTVLMPAPDPRRSPPEGEATPMSRPPPESPRLLELVSRRLRLGRYSKRTERSYLGWIERYVRFHRSPDGEWRHPRGLGPPHITEFLTHLAVEGEVSARVPLGAH